MLAEVDEDGPSTYEARRRPAVCVHPSFFLFELSIILLLHYIYTSRPERPGYSSAVIVVNLADLPVRHE